MHRKLRLISSSVLLLAMTTSCVTTSRFPEQFVTVQFQAVNLSGTGPGLAIATCPPERKLIGGGFLIFTASNPREYLVRGSYPDGKNSWILEIENFQTRDEVAVQALAYCLDVSRVPATITTEKLTGTAQTGGASLGRSAEASASCPTGSALTGGGFRIGGELVSGDSLYNVGVQESSPTPSEWTVRMDARLMAPGRMLPFESYAVCATSPIKPGTIIREPLPIAGTAQSAVAPKCGPDSFVTAGGFYQSLGPTSLPMPFRAFESASTSDFQEWTVDLFAPTRNALDPNNPGNVVSLAGGMALCLPIPPLS